MHSSHFSFHITADSWREPSIANYERLARLHQEDARLAALGVQLPLNAPWDFGSGAYGEASHDFLFPRGL